MQEGAGEVEGRGQAVAAQDGEVSSQFEKEELLIEFDAITDAQPCVEIEQVHAAPQQDVLAIVDFLGSLPSPAGTE